MRTMIGLALCLGLVACGDDDGTPMMDSGTDTGGGTDSGRDSAMPMPDTGTDSGPSDPCTATDMNAVDTVACNGEPVGPEASANAFYGTCTPGDEENPAGSCTGENAFCAAGEGETEGTCLAACPPAGSYVTTGGCPTGSRCFSLDTDFAICFPDCRNNDDCRDGDECDSEGSCVSADTPMPDGGMMDAGMSDAGADAGVAPPPDAG